MVEFTLSKNFSKTDLQISFPKMQQQQQQQESSWYPPSSSWTRREEPSRHLGLKLKLFPKAELWRDSENSPGAVQQLNHQEFFRLVFILWQLEKTPVKDTDVEATQFLTQVNLCSIVGLID